MFQSPKPEQSVMQALESLNEQQVRFSILSNSKPRPRLGFQFANIFYSGNRDNLQVAKNGTAAIMASHFQPEFVIQLLQ